MSKIVHATAFIAAFCFGSAALAADAAPPAAAMTPASTAAKPKVICRTEDTLGSRLGTHKTCMTAEQWRKQARDQADDLDRRLRTPHVEQ